MLVISAGFLPLLLSFLTENWLKNFFFTFNKSVTHIDTPRVQWAEEKCLLCKIVSSGETAEAGTADTEYTGETELSKYPLSTFRYGVYPINSAYLKALQDLILVPQLHQSELASFFLCRTVILGSSLTIPFPPFLCWIMSFLVQNLPLSGCFLGQFAEQHSEKCYRGDHLFWDFV